MSGVLSVYVTVPDEETARHIARTVVDERLAACANILPGCRSVYRWQGQVEEAGEVALILKTASARFPALERRIRELHPYEVPCIVAWEVRDGHGPYLDWVTAETVGGEGKAQT